MCNDCFINKFRDELLEQMKDYYQAFYEENYPNEIEDAVNKLSEDEIHSLFISFWKQHRCLRTSCVQCLRSANTKFNKISEKSFVSTAIASTGSNAPEPQPHHN